VRLDAGWRVRVRLALTHRGLRTLERAKRLQLVVRFVVAGPAGARQVERRTVTMRARGGT
jgi:hypothetical protein